MKNVVCEICGLVWLLALLGGTGYAVFGLHRSPWWFAAAFLLLGWKCPPI